MKYCFVIALFMVVSCTNNKRKIIHGSTKIDTAKLFDPNPQSGATNDFGTLFYNCVMLREDGITVSIVYERKDITSIDHLEDTLRKYRDEIQKQKFYLNYGYGTSFNKILEVIDVIKASGIDNYKVVELPKISDSLYVPKDYKQ
jgi:hypothetical protein